VEPSDKEDKEEPAPHGRSRPLFVTLTFLLCSGAFLLELYENGQTYASDTPQGSEECHYRADFGRAVFCAASLSVNPLFGPTTDVLIKMGASESMLTVSNKEVWRLVTPMYLHGGVVHFALNMLVFVKFGVDMERTHGFARVAAIYLLSGVFGIMMGIALSPHTVKVGASGAIFGLFGALLGEVLQNWSLYRRPCAAVVQLLLGASLQLLLGTMPMLDNFSHFFGFLMGFLCSLVLLVLGRRTDAGKAAAPRCHQRLVQALATACILVCFAFALLSVFGPVNAGELCPRCDMISCIPFPWGCNPTKQGSCWAWDCTAAQAAGCSGSASWIGSKQNGTVVLGCRVGVTDMQNVEVWPVDLSRWGTPFLTELCQARCP